jgi:dTDP-4-dehydrorhamnose reductase
MKKIVLIGASGQLGNDIVKVGLNTNNFEIKALSHSDIDITNFNQTKLELESIGPDIVINTAAYHKVDEVEDNPEKAFLVNSVAEKNLAELSASNGWTLVYLSTDYLFGHEQNKTTAYIETDNPAPINVYGVSKMAGEALTRYISPKHFIVRVSGLYGTAGSSGKGGNFVELMIRLGKEKGEVKVVNDQILTPTYTLNIAQNLLSLLETTHYGTYHMTSEGQCSWHQFAREIFDQLNMNVNCAEVTSDAFPTRAKRPHYSVLENANLNQINLNKMNDWKTNLHLYLIEKGHLNQ